MSDKHTKRAFATSILILAIALASCAARTKAIKAPKSIASLEKVNIGGVEQWLLIRGYDTSNPVLLFLHGGPGVTEMPLAHDMWPELEKKFVFVHWDQRGAGKSYHRSIPPDTMNFNQYLSDTHEVVELLRTRFGAKKIYLVGHSWGSQLGIPTVQKYPELFYAYVGIGQVVNQKQNEAIIYQFVIDEATKRQNRRAIRQLNKIGPPPYDNIKKIGIERKWMMKFGGVACKKQDYRRLYWQGLTSKEYTPLDWVRFFRGGSFSGKCRWHEFWTFNLFEQAPRIEVPVYFFVGRHDYNTPWILAEKYYQILDAPKGKTLIWFENSAHLLPFEEPEKFSDVMINRVLAETY